MVKPIPVIYICKVLNISIGVTKTEYGYYRGYQEIIFLNPSLFIAIIFNRNLFAPAPLCAKNKKIRLFY